MHFFLCRRAKEVWPDLQGSDPQQVRWRCDLDFIWCKWLQRVCFNHSNFAPSILGAAQTLCAASSSFLPYWVISQWVYSVRKQHCSLLYMSNIAAYRSTNAYPFATFTFNFCACSLVPGWPQEGDLSHRQPRAVLWAGWHPTRVSCFPIIDHNYNCPYFSAGHLPLTLRTHTRSKVQPVVASMHQMCIIIKTLVLFTKHCKRNINEHIHKT